MSLSASASHNALIAFNRFGLGARPGGAAAIGNDPKGALRAEVNTAHIAAIHGAELPSYAFACSESQMGHERADAVRQIELNARVDKQMAVPIGFVERLVMFWTNHFAMDVAKGATVRGTIGQWERSVIRAHALGKFSDMLIDTVQHPAMLDYLDNADSVGPNSPVGKKAKRGYNENLAREVMELHTIGSAGGYTETDVTNFARILTGYSYVRSGEAAQHRNGGNSGNRGQFIWRSDWHEPGAITLLKKSYVASGEKQAIAALLDLAHRSATAEHIAFKLVRHFICDAPSAAMVRPLKSTFIKTGGDLKAMALALLDLPAAWSAPLTKFRTPYEMTLAQYRALGQRFDPARPGQFAGPLRLLDNMVWSTPSPEGFSDDNATWLAPDQARVRAAYAQFTSFQLAPQYSGDPVALGQSLFDSALSNETRTAIASLRNANNGLTVLFASPEFQRR